MQQTNTKKHWTALAIARYYEQFGTAARARDLHPYVVEIHDDPNSLINTLNNLDNADEIDHLVVQSPTSKGGATKTFAYYPTPITIEELRDLGEPTELPDDTPIPEEVDTTIPTDRVTEDDVANLRPTESDALGLEYKHAQSGDGGTLPSRDYDTSEVGREPDATIHEEARAERGADADDHACPDCGAEFDSGVELGGHRSSPCTEQDDEAEHTCPFCGEEFDSGRAVGGHKRWCRDAIHEEARAERAVEDDSDAVELTEFDPSTSAAPIADIPGPMGLPGSEPVAGTHAGDTDWSRIATRLERKAMDAHDAGLTEVASAYSQFSTLAVEGDLDKRTAYILLGTPILELEDTAAGQVI